MRVRVLPLTTCRRMSSGTLRGWRQRAWAEECEKMTGARDTARASRIVCCDTWERSTSMPSRFISSTTFCRRERGRERREEMTVAEEEGEGGSES